MFLKYVSLNYFEEKLFQLKDVKENIWTCNFQHEILVTFEYMLHSVQLSVVIFRGGFLGVFLGGVLGGFLLYCFALFVWCKKIILVLFEGKHPKPLKVLRDYLLKLNCLVYFSIYLLNVTKWSRNNI